jgi:photosystem II stability/assembly factor-like uncharacterized protein
MRILVGTKGGLHVVRWVHGERAAKIEKKEFVGQDVTSIVPAGDGLYVAVAGAGVFRSDDDADSWHRVTANLDGHKVSTVTVSPRDPLLLYAGTEPPAIHISRDGGETWEELKEFRVLGVREGWRDYGTGAAHVQSIACDPHERRRVYAGVEIGGAYRSDNGGQTWKPINEGLFDDIHQLVVDPRDGSRLYAATGGGLFMSKDRGSHWKAHPEELAERYCIRLEAVVEQGTDRSAVVIVTAAGPPGTWEGSKGNAHPRLHLSRDAGERWEEFDTRGMSEKGAFTALAADPTARQAGFIGTSTGRLYYGSAGASRWSKILYGLPPVRVLRLL